MQEMPLRSLGWDRPLEEGMATQPGILAWRIPWREEPGGPQSMGVTEELNTTKPLNSNNHGASRQITRRGR